MTDQRLRGRAGQRQRARRLANEPLCRDCQAEGRVTQADEVDHIKPLSLGGKDEDDNCRSLCTEHHKARTAEQFGRHAYRPNRGVGADGWPL